MIPNLSKVQTEAGFESKCDEFNFEGINERELWWHMVKRMFGPVIRNMNIWTLAVNFKETDTVNNVAMKKDKTDLDAQGSLEYTSFVDACMLIVFF